MSGLLKPGLYEQLIDSILSESLSELDPALTTTEALDDGDSHDILAAYLQQVISSAFKGYRGHDRLSRQVDQQPISNVDVVTVAARIPRAVICLVSALAFHYITTQIPHAVSVALERGAESPRLDYPPIIVHRFSGDALTQGIQERTVDSVAVRIYSPEKTLADCFRFRNKLGMDVVLEALKLYKARKSFNIGELLKYARICRVEAVMKPYIEAML